MQKQTDRKRLLRRIFSGVVCVFVFAGVTAIALFMSVYLPSFYRQQASRISVPLSQAAESGSIVSFGTYEQDNDLTNGKEAIEWIVLDRQEDRALLLSRYALDCVRFNTADAIATWDHSTILTWLNDTFFDTAFDGAEKLVVLSSEIDVDKNPYFKTDPGAVTNEKVFIMSISEAKQYLGAESKRKCRATDYACAQGVRTDEIGNCTWWLRSPGYDASAATRMLTNGTINYCGYRVHCDNTGVRPSIWVSLLPDAAA